MLRLQPHTDSIVISRQNDFQVKRLGPNEHLNSDLKSTAAAFGFYDSACKAGSRWKRWTILHRLENPGKVLMELIEVQAGSYLGEDDIIQDDYRRVCRVAMLFLQRGWYL